MVIGMLPVTAMAAEGEIPEQQEQAEAASPEEDSFDGTQPDPVQNDLPAPLSSAGDLPEADSDGVITLTDGEYALPAGSNMTADIVISSGNVALDLNGGTLQNTSRGRATLTVQAGAAATVKNGTIQGGTGYYNIENFGTATLEALTATAGNADSSMICNHGTLTIQSGTYTGGMNTVKNEPNAELTIYDGTFTLTDAVNYNYNGTVMNYGNAVIRGGEFSQTATTPQYGYPQVIVSAVEEGGPQAMTEIYGGTFKATHSKGGVLHGLNKATSNNFHLYGGTYNMEPGSGYIADGYAAVKNGKTYIVGKAPDEIALSETSLRLAIDETATLTATALPADAVNTDVTWSSSNKNIATVNSSTGKITPKSAGTVTITAKAKAGGVTATCEVEVYLVDVAQIGDIPYTSLKDAIDAAQDGETITVIRNITSSTDIDLSNINKTVKIDLNGHTLTLANSKKIQITGSNSVLNLKNGTVNGNRTLLILCYEGATVNLSGITGVNSKKEGTSSTAYSNFIQVGSNGTTGYSTITDCDLTAGGNVVYILGKPAADSSDPSTCTITNSSLTGRVPVSGNGNCRANVTIQSGTLTAQWPGYTTDISAVYWPGAGTLTIEGGMLSGDTAVYAKSGTIEIKGGVFTASGNHDYVYQGNGFTPTGDAIVLDSCGYPGGAPVLNITGGEFTSINRYSVASYTGNGCTDSVQTAIQGGYFTSDPSAYVTEGYIAAATDEPGYAYMVTKLEGETIADAPAQKETEATVADGIPAEKVEATAKSVALPDVTGVAAQEMVSNTSKEEAAKQLQDKVTVTAGETITVYKQVYLEVVATGYESKTEGGETITSLTMDITPMMQLVASTAATAEGIVLEKTADKAQNAIPYGDAKELHITKPTQITVTLPTEFANKDVYIKHEASSGTYFYTGKADANGNLTFTSEHGFSPFTFSTVNEAEAQIGSIGYPTFQAAVDAAKSGDIIQIIKHTEDGYKATAEKTVTVENKTGSQIMVEFNEDMAAIPADDSYTFTYVTAVPVTGVTLDKPALSLDLGNVVTLAATITPDNATDKTAAWTSSDENIVTVKDGVVTAVGYGTAVVTVKVGTVEASCTVTVPYPYIPVVPTQPTKPTQPDTPDEPDTPVVPAVNYADVSANDWYYDEVAYVTAKGLMTGTTATTFAPNATTTRAMVWTILGRMTGAKVDGGEPWYSLAQSWAMSSGVSDGTNPNGSITREELAVMLYRYAGSPAVGLSELAKLGQFTDGETVSGWAQEAMAWAVSNGIISGSGSAILPQQSATRAQVAAMLMRFCELNNK